MEESVALFMVDHNLVRCKYLKLDQDGQYLNLDSDGQMHPIYCHQKHFKKFLFFLKIILNLIFLLFFFTKRLNFHS